VILSASLFLSFSVFYSIIHDRLSRTIEPFGWIGAIAIRPRDLRLEIGEKAFIFPPPLPQIWTALQTSSAIHSFSARLLTVCRRQFPGCQHCSARSSAPRFPL
jgi:hypothetical protein